MGARVLARLVGREQVLLELVRAHHKDVNAALSKLGRGIDKAMTAQLNLPFEKLSSLLLVDAVHRHLVSGGVFDAALAEGDEH